jgi:hypothetical protein
MWSVLRTLIVTAALCCVVALVFWRITVDQRDRMLAARDAMIEEMQTRLDERREMIDRLQRSHRLAHVHITDQRETSEGTLETDVLLIELEDDGTELARQAFTIPGPVLFIDAWTVKFDPEAVAIGHPLRGRSLVLLRRIYSERMPPAEGFAIDTPGAVPPAYAASEIGRFEQQVWEHFWEIASDAELAQDMLVRVAQGEAVYKHVQTGQRFELIVDAVGGISLTPLPEDAVAATSPTVADG